MKKEIFQSHSKIKHTIMRRFIINSIRKISLNLKSRDGFTLIEVIIATALSAMVLLMIYTAHRSIMFSIKDMVGIADFYENINIVISRIDRDISSAIYDQENTKFVFTGKNEPGVNSKGKISFITVNHSDFNVIGDITKNFTGNDVKQVEYYLKNDPVYPDLYYLMRRENFKYYDKPDEGGVESVMLMNVTDLKFEFTEQKNWENSWDSTDIKKYPKAVKTTLKVKNFKAVEETFEFITEIKTVN